MYSAKNLQVNILKKSVLVVVEQENGTTIDISVQSKLAFQTSEDRKMFYKSYAKHDKYQRIEHNHRKVPTIYCTPILRNILDIHHLSDLSYDTEPKYLTSGTQQQFFSAPGS